MPSAAKNYPSLKRGGGRGESVIFPFIFTHKPMRLFPLKAQASHENAKQSRFLSIRLVAGRSLQYFKLGKYLMGLVLKMETHLLVVSGNVEKKRQSSCFQ